MIIIGRILAKPGRLKTVNILEHNKNLPDLKSKAVQNSVIHIEIEFQKLLNRLLYKIKLYLSVVCTSWAV